MARTTRKSSSRSGGITLFGLLAGVILGLAAAVAVALFVTKAPMPFVDKASRDPERVALPDVREAPDPNSALQGRGQGSTPTVPGLPGAPAGQPPVADSGATSMSDDIDRLIASLGEAERAAKQAPAASARASAPATAATTAPAPAPKPPAAATQTTYYLQVGAFRSENDAEALKARILMLGLNGFVQKTQVDGATLHRVRLGPFRGIDDMNRSRARLGEEKIASTVVRP